MSNIIPITNLSAPELAVYCLPETQLFHYFEPKKGLFIAESPKVIERALDAGYTPFSFLMEEIHIAGEAAHIIARCPDVPVYTASSRILAELTGFHLTRGVLCAMGRRQQPEPRGLCACSRRIALLEHVMNPTNVGAIIRSAAALGMDAVLVTPSCSDPLYRRAIRVSMGTVFQIPWAYLKAESPVNFLKELGFKTAAMALSPKAISIADPVLKEADKLAIVLGSEGEGLEASTLADCDYTVTIPMYHRVDSLNVAAASAVAFWEVRHYSCLETGSTQY